MAADTLQSVLVAGGGITGWCASAALKRRAPFLDVTILASTPPRVGLADMVACTLPSALGFHADLGIGLDDGIARTGSGLRLGTLFSDWAPGLPAYVHAYGRYGRSIGGMPFHLAWLKAVRAADVAPFERFSAAAALARAGRIAPTLAGIDVEDPEFGLTIDPLRYLTMMRAFALHVGVREINGDARAIRIDERGCVAAVALGEGRDMTADLFVDATGPDAKLRGALDQLRDDWSAWLPCDRVLLAQNSDTGSPRILTAVTAHAAGWSWTSGVQSGIAYASGHLADDAAARALGTPAADPIRVRPGTRREPWRGNCVAIGEAATEIEPLEWCNLHLALSAIDRLVTMLPGRAPAAVEIAEYNRQTVAEAERVRDMLAAHYRTASRDDEMWRDIAQGEPPASLAHTLEQWKERGRLPFYEEETFPQDGWAAVLLGQSARPRRIDPLADELPIRELETILTEMATGIAAAVPRAPLYADYLAAQTKRVAA